MGKLVLSIAIYTLEITKFGNSAPSEYPRSQTQWPRLEYTPRKGSVLTNTFGQPKSLWTINARLNEVERKILSRMFGVWLGTPTLQWFLEDHTQQVSEVLPRTRAIALGTSEDSDGTTVLYYPRYKVVPTEPPNLVEYSKEEFVIMQFSEADFVPAF